MKRFTLSVVMTGGARSGGIYLVGCAAARLAADGGTAAGRSWRTGRSGGGSRVLRGANLSDEQKAAIKAIRDAERRRRIRTDRRRRSSAVSCRPSLRRCAGRQKIAALQQQLARRRRRGWPSRSRSSRRSRRCSRPSSAAKRCRERAGLQPRAGPAGDGV